MKVVRAGSFLALVMAVALGCGHPQPGSTRTPTPTPPPKVPSLIDPRWMSFDKTQPWNWEDVDRKITTEYQEFGFRPMGETEFPHGCNGCGEYPSTARVRVYAPGKFDPGEFRTGQPVSVNGADGFLRPAPGPDDRLLAWQYADNAWATATGTTTITAKLEPLLELARALRPDDRSPVRLPLSLPTFPAAMPLAAFEIEPAPYGTIVTFDQCTTFGPDPASDPAAPKCAQRSDSLRVQIWRRDGYDSLIDETRAVAIKIGGKDDKYDKPSHVAAVQVDTEMLVVFELSGPYPAPPTTSLEDVLNGVKWAAEPGNDATWQAVTDWTK